MKNLRAKCTAGFVFALPLIIPISVMAQTSGSNGGNPSDFAVLAVAIVNGFFGLAIAVATIIIQRHVKDKQMAELLSNAVQNSVGAVQQAATKSIQGSGLLKIDVGSPEMKTGVDYVINNAEEAVKHFKISPEKIASKIEAKIGLAAVATNLATTASSPPYIAGPLAPVPAGREQIPS